MSDDEHSADGNLSGMARMMRLFQEWGNPMMEGEASLESRDRRWFANEMELIMQAFEGEAKAEREADIAAGQELSEEYYRKQQENLVEKRKMLEMTKARMFDHADAQEIREIANCREQLERMEACRSRAHGLLENADTDEALEAARDELESFSTMRDFGKYLTMLNEGIATARTDLEKLEPGAKERWGEDYESEVETAKVEFREKRDRGEEG